MEQMKVLITGATGFVGGHFLRYFSSLYGKQNVHGTGRNKEQVEVLKAEGFTLLCGDLLDINFVSTHLASYDVYVHCAAKSSIWGTYNSFYLANVLATKNLLACVPSGSQFIYLSSANMYFTYSNRTLICEDDELCLTSFYAKTKREAELLVLNTAKINPTILRARAIVGIGDTVVFPRVIRAYNEGRLRIIGSGDNKIDFTSINNLCLAVHLSIKNRVVSSGQVYNISNGDTIVLWDEIKNILTKLGYTAELKTVPYSLAYLVAKFKELKTNLEDNEPAMTCYGVAVLNYSMSLDSSKAFRELGYVPAENSLKTLSDFVLWFKNESLQTHN